MTYAAELVGHYTEVRQRLGVRVVDPKPATLAVPKPSAPSLPPSLELIEKHDGMGSAPLNMLTPSSMRFLIAYAALAGGVSVQDILGDDRQKKIAAARHHAMALVYQHTQASLLSVGRHFKRDHTTVLHALRKRGAQGKLVEMLQSASSRRRAKARQRAIEAAEYTKGLPSREKAKLPPRSEDPHTPRSNLQKAVARAYRHGVPTALVVDAYGTTKESIHVTAHKLGLKRKDTVAKSKLDWVARGREVRG